MNNRAVTIIEISMNIGVGVKNPMNLRGKYAQLIVVTLLTAIFEKGNQRSLQNCFLQLSH